MNLKQVVISAAALLFATIGAAASPLFEEGAARYKEGDFKGAVESFQQALAAGQGTAAVHYNLGNALFKAGDKGLALVHYERARKVSPRDADLQWNIHVLKGVLADKIEDRSHFTLAALRDFLARWTADELALTFTAALGFWALLSAAGFLFPSVRSRLSWLRSPVLAGVLVFGAVFALRWMDTKDPRVVVLDRETTAYYGPSERETKAFVLHEGAEGKVTDESGEWLYIALGNGNTGWIRKNSCEII